MLRHHYPFYELKDISPHIHRMRMIKTAREIEILKLNGRIAAEAINRAIAVTRQGRFEYEIEAEATYHHVRNGDATSRLRRHRWFRREQQHLALPRQAGKRVEAGEMVVMDYGRLPRLHDHRHHPHLAGIR